MYFQASYFLFLQVLYTENENDYFKEVIMQVSIELTDVMRDFFEIATNELALTISDNGKPLQLIQRNGSLKIENKENETFIYFQEKAHLFRALSLWLDRCEEEFVYEEFPQFEKIGPMVDFSRNAVMTVDQLKHFFVLCSKMGLNSCMLYMEDTYQIPDYTYFGYCRGAYSLEELKALDAFADTIGIELIPCIQTLAHLTNPLKWGFANGMRDTSDILLVEEEKTYQFLDRAISVIAAAFKTSKIHIGMDEAHDLGRGHYLTQHGLIDRFDIMEKHLKKVMEICRNYQLQPMMWSDMFFRIGSKSGDYYDKDVYFPEDLIAKIPEISMVYWDYYHHSKEEYQLHFSNHKKLQRPIVFAGGIWTWNGLAPNYGKSFETTSASLSVAKEEKINEVYATLWGDDSAETPIIASLLGLQQFSEEQFAPEVSMELIKERFRLFHHLEADDFLLLDAFDQTKGVAKNNPDGSNSSKLALYQDLLYGLYDVDLQNLELPSHYKDLSEKLSSITANEDTQTMFTFYQKLAQVLFVKTNLIGRSYRAYQSKRNDQLQLILHELEVLTKKINELQHLHRQLWFEWNKPFGYEIIDLRYGALKSRIETTVWRLKKFLTGEIKQLPELEQTPLPFDAPFKTASGVGRNLFHGIYSASKLSDI